MRHSHFRISLLASLLPLSIGIAAQEQPAFAGFIQEFWQPPKSTAKIQIQRYASNPNEGVEEVMPLTPVYQGDKVIVPPPSAWVCLDLREANLVEVTPQNSPYEVKQQGTVPTRWGNFIKSLGKLLMPLLQTDQEDTSNPASADSHCAKPVHQQVHYESVNIKSGGIEPVATSWQGRQLSLFAGKRPFHLPWWGGQSPYMVTVTVTAADGTALFSFSQQTEQPLIKTPEVEFQSGEYRVTVKDNAKNETSFSFKVEAPIAYPPEVTAKELPEPLQKTLQATWLATQENGKWSFEAYQQVANIAENYYPARLLYQGLEAGRTFNDSNQ